MDLGAATAPQPGVPPSAGGDGADGSASEELSVRRSERESWRRATRWQCAQGNKTLPESRSTPDRVVPPPNRPAVLCCGWAGISSIFSVLESL